LIDFENIDHLLEIIEHAAGRQASNQVRTAPGIVHVMNENFWASVINTLLLRFNDFSFSQLIDMVVILHKMGFDDGLELQDSVLSDALLMKKSKLKARFRVEILRNYVVEQIDMYGDEIAEKPINKLGDLLDKMNLLYVC